MVSSHFDDNWDGSEIYLKAMDLLKVDDYDEKSNKWPTINDDKYEEFFKFIYNNKPNYRNINERLIHKYDRLIDHNPCDKLYDSNCIDIRLYILDYLSSTTDTVEDYNVIRNLHEYFESNMYYQCLEILIYNNCPNDIFKLYLNHYTDISTKHNRISQLISKTFIYDQFDNYNSLVDLVKKHNMSYEIILNKYIVEDNNCAYEWRRYDETDYIIRKFLPFYEQNKLKYNITDELIKDKSMLTYIEDRKQREEDHKKHIESVREKTENKGYGGMASLMAYDPMDVYSTSNLTIN